MEEIVYSFQYLNEHHAAKYKSNTHFPPNKIRIAMEETVYSFQYLNEHHCSKIH
jgi:hypothetical protein